MLVVKKYKRIFGKYQSGCEKGLTLIEVLVALAIMGLTVAFIGGVYTALTASSVNTEFINAEQLAKSQMESIMREPYVMRVDYNPGDPENSYSVISIPQELVDRGYEIYIGTPQDVPGSSADIQKVTVEVRVSRDGDIDTIFKIVDYKLNSIN
jgi:prepilin-type N-terminal cleavage/methylation domain-containing protein